MVKRDIRVTLKFKQKGKLVTRHHYLKGDDPQYAWGFIKACHYYLRSSPKRYLIDLFRVYFKYEEGYLDLYGGFRLPDREFTRMGADTSLPPSKEAKADALAWLSKSTPF